MTIAWRLISDVADVQFRTWTFLSHYNKSFAHISGDGNVIPNLQYSPGPFTIKKPATLILENVTIQYDGIYRFISLASGQSYSSDVTVIIEGKCLLYTPFTLLFSFYVIFYVIFNVTHF